MPCYHPVKGFFSRDVNESGKRSLVFTLDRSLVSEPTFVPCGRCIGCRLDRSLSWAVRCVHESQMHDKNCFVTLTYDDKHLPADGSLTDSDFPLFMKKLRQFLVSHEWRVDSNLGGHYVILKRHQWHRGVGKVRFFQCGEYGEKGSRPHHHACLFGFRPDDLVLCSERDGVFLYSSKMLSDIWEKGFVTVGDVTYQSAAYVARYVLKKWSSQDISEQDLYNVMRDYDLSKRTWLSKSSSKKAIFDLCKSSSYGGKRPEFVTMSRRPGIGDSWYAKFKGDLFPHGFAVLPSGKTIRVPQYYDLKFSLENPFKMAMIKGERLVKAQSCPDNSPARLAVREEVKRLTIQQLKRGYEYEG